MLQLHHLLTPYANDLDPSVPSTIHSWRTSLHPRESGYHLLLFLTQPLSHFAICVKSRRPGMELREARSEEKCIYLRSVHVYISKLSYLPLRELVSAAKRREGANKLNEFSRVQFSTVCFHVLKSWYLDFRSNLLTVRYCTVSRSRVLAIVCTRSLTVVTEESQ